MFGSEGMMAEKRRQLVRRGWGRGKRQRGIMDSKLRRDAFLS